MEPSGHLVDAEMAQFEASNAKKVWSFRHVIIYRFRWRLRRACHKADWGGVSGIPVYLYVLERNKGIF